MSLRQPGMFIMRCESDDHAALPETLIIFPIVRRTMQRLSIPSFGWQLAQQFDVHLALIIEVSEVRLRIGRPIDLEMHLRIVGWELRIVPGEKPVDPRPVAAPLGVER